MPAFVGENEHQQKLCNKEEQKSVLWQYLESEFMNMNFVKKSR